jgi:hypothetical protein
VSTSICSADDESAPYVDEREGLANDEVWDVVHFGNTLVYVDLGGRRCLGREAFQS